MTQQEIQQQALANALQGQAMTNYSAIFEGFTAKGITAADIKPRENVFTFHAWKALGRSVRRGEHGVKVVTFIPVTKRVKGEDGAEREDTFRRPWGTTVFHVSQTDPVS